MRTPVQKSPLKSPRYILTTEKTGQVFMRTPEKPIRMISARYTPHVRRSGAGGPFQPHQNTTMQLYSGEICADYTQGGSAAAGEAGVDPGGAMYVTDGDAWALGITGGSVYDVAVDSQGNIVVAGSTRGPLKLGLDATLPARPDGLFVAKLDANGHYLWGHAFSDNSMYSGIDVAVTPEDDIAIAFVLEGQTAVLGQAIPEADERDTLVIRLDSEGSLLWSRLLGGSGWQQFATVAVNQDGEIFVSGVSTGVLDFGGGARPSAGGQDAFFAKLGPDGSHVFSRVFGDGQDETAWDVATAANGEVLLTGNFAGTIDLGGGELTARGFDTKNLFIARYDSDGNHLHSQRIAGTSRLPHSCIAPASDDGVVICGSYHNTIELGDITYDTRDHSTSLADDGFLAIIDAQGDVVASHSFGGEELDGCNAVVVDSQGDIFATGNFMGVVNLGGSDLGEAGKHGLFYSHYDAEGAHLGSKGFVSDAMAYPRAIALLPSRVVLIGGYVSDGTLDLGFATVRGELGFVIAMPPP